MHLENAFEQFKLLQTLTHVALIALVALSVVLLAVFPSASTSNISFLLALRMLAGK